jgi:hypothetical protein
MLMLFQTFLQLNILILATPALAGWSLLPPVHAGTVRAVGIVWQYRGIETPVPKAAAQIVACQAKLSAAAAPRPLPAKPSVFAAVPAAALRICNSFPHAARAP